MNYFCCTESSEQHVSHPLRPLPQLYNVGAVSLPVHRLSLIIPTLSSTEKLLTTVTDCTIYVLCNTVVVLFVL